MCWSVGNAEPGLAGLGLGRSLIHGLLEKVRGDPQVAGVVTLSPIPGFSKWLNGVTSEALGALGAPHSSGNSAKDILELLEQRDGRRAAGLRHVSQRLAALGVPVTAGDVGALLQAAADGHLPGSEAERPEDVKEVAGDEDQLESDAAAAALLVLRASFRLWQRAGALRGRDIDRRADESVVESSHHGGEMAGMGADDSTRPAPAASGVHVSDASGVTSAERRQRLPVWAVGPLASPRGVGPDNSGSIE